MDTSQVKSNKINSLVANQHTLTGDEWNRSKEEVKEGLRNTKPELL